MKSYEMITALKTLGLPVAYQAFKKPTPLPYIVLIQDGDANFGADNAVYYGADNYRIEVYSRDKDYELERRVEKLLDDNEIYWERSADIRIEAESITEVMYHIQLERG